MKKLVLKNLAVILFIALLSAVSLPVLALPDFSNVKTGVGEDWIYGADEHWHLSLVCEKSEFTVGEKVQFFAQVGPIYEPHQWRLRLYNGTILQDELTNPLFTPDETFGWNYSNFTPYDYNLPIGEYRAEYWLDAGEGFELLGEASFNINYPENDYNFNHATTSLTFEYGVGGDYWNLKPINHKEIYAPGDRIYLMVQVGNIYRDHRYKVELFRSDNKLWEYEGEWLDVGAGWLYSNFYPYYDNARPGDYEFRVYIDTGDCYEFLSSAPFAVSGVIEDYTYDHTTIAEGWEYGEGSDYWNLIPLNPKTEFNPGERVYAMSQVLNIYVSHQWKTELFRAGIKLWDYETPWYTVGSGWTFGNFYPYYDNAQPGAYEFKIYINTGSGYELLDTKGFNVLGDISDYEYIGTTTICTGWEYGIAEDYWNLIPIDPKTEFSIGDKVYALTKIKNVYVDHRWKAELYRSSVKMWSYETDFLDVGTGWSYGSFYPYYDNAQAGTYEFRIYLDTGEGFEIFDTSAFNVI